MKYRKKPIVIDAIQWTGDNLRKIIDFTGLHPTAKKWSWEQYKEIVANEGLKIFTLEGAMMANIGDWIIKGVKGEFYPCKSDIFKITYEPLDEPKGEPEKWEYMERNNLRCHIKFRNQEYDMSEVLNQVLQELADAKAINSSRIAEYCVCNYKKSPQPNCVCVLCTTKRLEEQLQEAKAEIARMKPQPPEKMVCSGCGEIYDKSNIKDWITYWSESGVITHKHKYICGYAIPESLFNKEKK